jgi:predicted GNAT family N-acyltransferase
VKKPELPRYPNLPATLIGRLAPDLSFRGQRIGELLLLNALERALAASEQVASAVVIVDAKDDRAAEFYRRFGFISFPETKDRLFLPMRTVQTLFSQPSLH